MRLRTSILTIFISVYSVSAFAYLDPASGSAIMSAIIGFFVATAIVLKTYWYKIKSLFTGDKKKKKQHADSVNKKQP